MVGLSKTFLAFVLLIALSVFVSGCSGQDSSGASQQRTPVAQQSDQAAPQQTAVSTPAWMDAELTDVASGDTFRISDFKGKPVLLENFAVWCPVCTRQQQESKKLEQSLGDSIVSVSLDSDQNEDEARIREHIERNGFDWYYAVAPAAVTNSLIDDFGVSFVNVPLAPMVVICGDQTTHRLRNGVKSADELGNSITELCGAI